MVKKIITGNCGFIGKHITKYGDGAYDLVDGFDIRDPYKLDIVFENCLPDIAIHLAALPGVIRSKLYPKDYISTNVEGTWNVVKMCEKYKVKLIHFSSSSVYGDAYPPIKEEYDKKPISLYGITKLAGEHIVNNASCKTTIIRPFTVYGEENRKDQLIGKWLKCIQNGRSAPVYGDGESCRGYTYIGDINKVVEILSNMNWTWEHEDFNIGGSKVIKLKDIKNIFLKKFPTMKFNQESRKKEDVFQQYADVSKASKVLGFIPDDKLIERLESIIR